MFRSVPRRWLVLGGTLLATVVASVWPRGEESPALEVVAPSARGNEVTPKREQTSPAQAELPPLGERLERPQGAKKVENLFAATSWTAPSSKLAAPTPTAPPFPYAFAGILVDNDVLTVVFTKQNQHFVLRAGEVLENTYRLDEINSHSITGTYLPLGQKQILPLGTLN